MSAAQDRCAVVTGGSRGIGRAAVQRLATDGFGVVVGYRGGRSQAEEVVENIVALGGRAVSAQLDVAEEAEVERLFQEAADSFGGVDVVVHAAGETLRSPLAEMDLDAFDRMCRTNVRGTMVVNRCAARRVRPGGAIINLSSSATRRALPGHTGYAATKAAVDMISTILAKELGERDVTVNAVAPGATATEMFFEGRDEQAVAAVTSAIPLGRLGRPDDIGEVISFLAGPGRWVNGQTIHVNGGAS